MVRPKLPGAAGGALLQRTDPVGGLREADHKGWATQKWDLVHLDPTGRTCQLETQAEWRPSGGEVSLPGGSLSSSRDAV